MAAIRTRASASETGGDPFAVQIDVGVHSILGDEPASAGGRGLGPNPFELLAASLAACTAITVRWYARQQNWPIDHVEATVLHTKKLLDGSSTPVDVFEKTLFVRSDGLDDLQRARLVEIAARCPVQRILEGTPVFHMKLGQSLDEVLGKRP